MALAEWGTFINANNATSSTSWTVANTQNIWTAAYGVFNPGIFVFVATDNISTVSGETNTHLTLTDTKGNVWEKMGERTSTASSTADGVTGSLWVSYYDFDTVLTTSDSYTVTFSQAVVAKTIIGCAWCSTDSNLVNVKWSIAGWEFNPAGTQPLAVSQTVEDTTKNWHLVRFCAQEGTGSPTGSGSPVSPSGTTGVTTLGTASSNIRTFMEYSKVPVGNATQSLSCSWASVAENVNVTFWLQEGRFPKQIPVMI